MVGWGVCKDGGSSWQPGTAFFILSFIILH